MVKEENKRLYQVWQNMKSRCYNINNCGYHNYGGRGIKVCKEWLEDFNIFKNWALKNGYDINAEKRVCTLDRINVNGNYEPSNCRWVTMKEQSNNTRFNKKINYNGKTLTVAQWAEELNMQPYTIYSRLKLNLPMWQVLYNGNLMYGKKKIIIQKDLHGNIIKEWNNQIKNIAKQLNLPKQDIIDCMEHKINSCGGYIWRYKDDISD